MGQALVVELAIEGRLVVSRPRRLVGAAVLAISALGSPSARAEGPPVTRALATSLPASPPVLDRTRQVGLDLTWGHLAQTPDGPVPSTMVRETREVVLAAGRTELVWTELPESLRGETAQLAVLAGAGVSIASQRLEETTPGPEGLTALLVGQRVRARPEPTYGDTRGLDSRRGRSHDRDAAGAGVGWSGAIVSLEGGVVLRVGKELTVLPPASLTLSEPARATPRRQLVVELLAAASGPVRLTLTALVERLGAQPPRYRLALDRGPSGTTAQLTGSVLVTNRSGQSMEGARLFLGAVTTSPRGAWERRAAHEPSLPATWLAREVPGPPPFPALGPLRFGGSDLGEAPLVDKPNLPIREHTRATFAGLDELREKPERGTLQTSIRRAWLISQALGLSAPLPSGATFVTESTPSGPPAVLAQAFLTQGWSPSGEEPVAIEVRTAGLWLESRQLSAQARGDCLSVVKWEHLVPPSALEHGPFELELMFPKARLEASLDKASKGANLAATLEVMPGRGTRVVVAPLPVGDPRRAQPRRLVVSYRTNRCAA